MLYGHPVMCAPQAFSTALLGEGQCYLLGWNPLLYVALTFEQVLQRQTA